MKPLLEIGAAEGDEHRVFGAIADVALDSRHQLYVLDSRLNTVRIFDSTGAFVRAFGRPGQGPQEFQAPEALEVNDEDQILVADRYRRVKVFALADTGAILVRAVPLDLVPEGLCAAGDRFYVQGWKSDGSVVHAYSITGARSASFGAAYKSDNLLVQEQLSDGAVACTRDGSAVVLMYEFLPLIFGYSRDGSSLWTARLMDYRPMVIVETVNPEGRPGVTFNFGRPFNRAEGIVPVGRDLVAVQVSWSNEQSVTEQRDYAVLDTYLVSAATGKGVYVGRNLPRLGAVHLPTAYGFENDPYPRLVLLRDSMSVQR